MARVEIGDSAPLTIATAATNVAAGQTIAVATIGAQLPGLTIAPRTMRGVASAGMMISAEELALPGEWFEDGILQLEPETPLGRNAVELFGLDTVVLDVEITTNRPDAMSVLGLARELAASYSVPLQLATFENPGSEAEPPGETVEVTIESPDCRRFVAQRIAGLRVAPAPAWMRIRLALAGQRPINNVVDVSNYVMLETGQPLHFYDAARIAGNHLIVRSAREGEKIETLDGVERTLSPSALVIADEQRALCLAGLMGAAAGEVGADTTAIVLEAANFEGSRVRRMSAALALRSEASSRHEKSLPPALTDIGAARAARLLANLGGTVYRPRAYGADIARAAPIALEVSDVDRLLGLPLSGARIAEHLRAIGCEVSHAGGQTLCVVPPLERRDLTIAADLVEEVARIEGYDRIPAIVPSVAPHEISSTDYDLENAVAHALEGLGYREIVTHSLRGRGEVAVANPLSEEQRFLRDDLVDGALEYLGRSDASPRIFEIGETFRARGDGLEERWMLAFGFRALPSDEPPWRDSNFLRLKGDCERLLRPVTGFEPESRRASRVGLHPGKTAVLVVDGKEVGHAGAVDPRLAAKYELPQGAYLALLDLRALPHFVTPTYRPPSRFPSTYRDLALVVDDGLDASALERAIAEQLGEICTSARAFDEYRGAQVGEGRKSLAVRVVLQRFDATITDEEADVAIAGLLEALRAQFGAEIRA